MVKLLTREVPVRACDWVRVRAVRRSWLADTRTQRLTETLISWPDASDTSPVAIASAAAMGQAQQPSDRAVPPPSRSGWWLAGNMQVLHYRRTWSHDLVGHCREGLCKARSQRSAYQPNEFSFAPFYSDTASRKLSRSAESVDPLE